jgi:hypothetical protein
LLAEHTPRGSGAGLKREALSRDAAILARLSRLVSDRFFDRVMRLILRPHAKVAA